MQGGLYEYPVAVEGAASGARHDKGVVYDASGDVHERLAARSSRGGDDDLYARPNKQRGQWLPAPILLDHRTHTHTHTHTHARARTHIYTRARCP